MCCLSDYLCVPTIPLSIVMSSGATVFGLVEKKVSSKNPRYRDEEKEKAEKTWLCCTGDPFCSSNIFIYLALLGLISTPLNLFSFLFFSTTCSLLLFLTLGKCVQKHLTIKEKSTCLPTAIINTGLFVSVAETLALGWEDGAKSGQYCFSYRRTERIDGHRRQRCYLCFSQPSCTVDGREIDFQATKLIAKIHNEALLHPTGQQRSKQNYNLRILMQIKNKENFHNVIRVRLI